MCTVIILRRPGDDWPIVIGANRDEMKGRPWLAPARHWPERRHVTAGLDEEAGGTWLALGDDGIVAAILNRYGSLGPAPGKRSRGELPLEAVDYAEARVAASALAHLEPTSYRSFNLVIADAKDAFWLKSDGKCIEKAEIPEGVSMITAHDLNDTEGAGRIRYHLPRFRAAPPPDPKTDDWMSWEALLASTDGEEGANHGGALNIETEYGFATVSSSLLALPAVGRFGVKPVWKFHAGRPNGKPYLPVHIKKTA